LKLVWTRSAQKDRKKIREQIAKDNPAAALTLDELLEEKSSCLTNHPHLGRKGRMQGTRELVVHEKNYILIYQIASGLVRILRVLHRAQQWP
jgi:addiction module RelE/StbE family toxin